MQRESYGQFTSKEIVNILKISYKIYQNELSARPSGYSY